MSRNGASYGLSLEKYVERLGQTMEEWEKQARELAEARVKASLVLQILARSRRLRLLKKKLKQKLLN